MPNWKWAYICTKKFYFHLFPKKVGSLLKGKGPHRSHWRWRTHFKNRTRQPKHVLDTATALYPDTKVYDVFFNKTKSYFIIIKHDHKLGKGGVYYRPKLCEFISFSDWFAKSFAWASQKRVLMPLSLKKCSKCYTVQYPLNILRPVSFVTLIEFESSAQQPTV